MLASIYMVAAYFKAFGKFNCIKLYYNSTANCFGSQLNDRSCRLDRQSDNRVSKLFSKSDHVFSKVMIVLFLAIT